MPGERPPIGTGGGGTDPGVDQRPGTIPGEPTPVACVEHSPARGANPTGRD